MLHRRRNGFDNLSGIQSIFRNCSAGLKPDAASGRSSPELAETGLW